MARKKQEVTLQQELNSTDEWNEALAKEGLWVIDVYQEWCGPCVAMVGNFRRLKNELGDDLLKFAVAKADTVDALQKYKGRCEPCFLFFAGGELVSYVHGANAPLINRTVTEQLAQEHKVLDGSSERRAVKDPYVATDDDNVVLEEEETEESYVPHRRVSTYAGDYEEDDRRMFQYNDELVIYDDSLMSANDEEEEEEGYTVAIIKPNAVKSGKVDEILEEMRAHGIQPLAQEERQLTEEEARQFYSHLKDEEYFEDLVKFMASGPSHVLVLTKGQTDDSIIHDWRDMLGPPSVEEAKEQAPNSLRARYGSQSFMNAVHGSDSKDTAAREMAFFFPSLQLPTHKKPKETLQRTLALIRPEAFAQSRDEILEKIKEAGFQIALQRTVQLTKQQAEDFYSEHVGQPYFEELTNDMSSGPLLALGLARIDAIDEWRTMLGPKDVEEAKAIAPDSLRAQYTVSKSSLNQLHGSDSPKSAEKELNFFFPMEQTVAVIKPDAFGTKDAIIQKIHESGFRIAARKETTITHDIAESFYDSVKDKDYYDSLVDYMTSGPTMFMVLSREGAVEGWRQEIGPTDPEVARREAPDSIRAQFGQDILHNAVHGCSTQEEAISKIQKIFGPLDFASDGTVKAEPQQAEGQDAKEETPAVPDAAEQQPAEEAAPDQTLPADEIKEEPASDSQTKEEKVEEAGGTETATAEEAKAEDETKTETGTEEATAVDHNKPEATVDEGKDENKEEPQEQPKEESKEEPQEQPKEEPKEEPQEQPKEEPQEQPKEEPQEQPKEEPQEQPKEESKEEPQEQPKEESKEEPQEEPKEEPKEEVKEDTVAETPADINESTQEEAS
ncbi:thioredoxin domain-containing protein 3 homolog isoform X3 [Pomacea canaliculata]|uniref:thioredoxin domain-containing protein 3 homolog isoform X3 n=1 Tax=Pomacea canaliculata TaxID=400727 RepID=UPI000D732ADB|nr:thioredoxin domain-containing protein 3 homolog isoform X3 [Pomacea canaliculata]